MLVGCRMTPAGAADIRERLGTGKLVLLYRPLVDLCGSVAAALFASQMLYWTERTNDPVGWVYKTQLQWNEELGLTSRQVGNCRKKLRKRGFLEETLKGRTPATVHYRLTDAFRVALLQILPHVQTSNHERRKPDPTERPNQCRREVQTYLAETVKPNKEAETTAEIKAQTTNGDKKAIWDALAYYCTPDPGAVQKIIRECRAKVRAITAEEIAEFIHARGKTMGKNVRNPIAVLLTTVPRSISPEAVDTLRKQRAKEQEQKAEEKRSIQSAQKGSSASPSIAFAIPKPQTAGVELSDAATAWSRVLEAMASRMIPRTFSTWFEPTKGIAIEGEVLVVSVPTADWIGFIRRFEGVVVQAVIESSIAAATVEFRG